jgi:hypothetical protein
MEYVKEALGSMMESCREIENERGKYKMVWLHCKCILGESDFCLQPSFCQGQWYFTLNNAAITKYVIDPLGPHLHLVKG